MAWRKNQRDYGAARKLRKRMSLPQVLLWRELRRRAGGVKFRREYPVGKYSLAFYCAEAKLGIEVDGISHDMGDRPERDEIRDAFIAVQGIDVMRVPARDVLKSVTNAAEAIVITRRARLA